MARSAASRLPEHRADLRAWIRPQLTRLVDEPPDGPDWLHEIKFDGYRMHARFDRGAVRLLTRTGLDWRARLAHAKTMVVDGAVTLMGSYNWTRAASGNPEDLNLVSSPTVAAAYTTHWQQRLAVSVRFDRREDWCRVSSAEAR